MKLVLSIVVIKLLMTIASSNDVVVCKYNDIPDEDNEECSPNTLVNNKIFVETENKGEKEIIGLTS